MEIKKKLKKWRKNDIEKFLKKGKNNEREDK